MRVIIDTNVVISAALKDRRPEQVILFVSGHPEFDWVASLDILAEYVGVLRRKKFGLPEDVVDRWVVLFSKLVTIAEVQNTVSFPRGQKDAIFLACALATDADYFITGDSDFNGAHKVGSTTVISVSQFKKFVCDEWL